MLAIAPKITRGVLTPSDGAAYELHLELAVIAERFSSRSDELTTPAELALEAAALERSTAALALGVERAAHALGARARAGAPVTPPLPHAARALSWRRHDLAEALRGCRDGCRVVEEAAERWRVAAAGSTVASRARRATRVEP